MEYGIIRHFRGDGYSSKVSDLHLENVVIERLRCCVWVCGGGASVNAVLIGQGVQQKLLREENRSAGRRVQTDVECSKGWTVVDSRGED